MVVILEDKRFIDLEKDLGYSGLAIDGSITLSCMLHAVPYYNS